MAAKDDINMRYVFADMIDSISAMEAHIDRLLPGNAITNIHAKEERGRAFAEYTDVLHSMSVEVYDSTEHEREAEPVIEPLRRTIDKVIALGYQVEHEGTSGRG